LHWVLHLAGSTKVANLQTLVVSADSAVKIPAIQKDNAHDLLKSLVNAWYQGLQSPLPVACRTAFARLGANPDKADTAAKSQYEGDDWNNGEVNFDAYLARFFPSFASLNNTGINMGFEFWVNELYKPVFDHIEFS
jgi:exodeoxyribonuclease V gamma subunit